MEERDILIGSLIDNGELANQISERLITIVVKLFDYLAKASD